VCQTGLVRRSPWGYIVAAGILVAAAAACRESLPGAPSDLTTGVTVYEHANYTGESAHLTRSVADLKDFKGPCEHTTSGSQPGSDTTFYDWNDCASSIRVASGWRVQVFRDDDYKGQSLESSADVPNLQLVPGTCEHDGLNDCITSVRIYSPAGAVATADEGGPAPR
jgi:hypothetical protein